MRGGFLFTFFRSFREENLFRYFWSLWEKFWGNIFFFVSSFLQAVAGIGLFLCFFISLFFWISFPHKTQNKNKKLFRGARLGGIYFFGFLNSFGFLTVKLDLTGKFRFNGQQTFFTKILKLLWDLFLLLFACLIVCFLIACCRCKHTNRAAYITWINSLYHHI